MLRAYRLLVALCVLIVTVLVVLICPLDVVPPPPSPHPPGWIHSSRTRAPPSTYTGPCLANGRKSSPLGNGLPSCLLARSHVVISDVSCPLYHGHFDKQDFVLRPRILAIFLYQVADSYVRRHVTYTRAEL